MEFKWYILDNDICFVVCVVWVFGVLVLGFVSLYWWSLLIGDLLVVEDLVWSWLSVDMNFFEVLVVLGE